MDKLLMCRICLAEKVRMYEVVNKKLHELYEKLTGNSFVTEDSRPMLACFICCTKLKQCYQLQRKCLESEELLTQMINEDYELDHLQCYDGLVRSPMVLISIKDECQTKSDAVKVPAVCEELTDVIEPEEEHQSDLELENRNNNVQNGEDVLRKKRGTSNTTLILLTDVQEEQGVLRKKRRVSHATRSAVAKKLNLFMRRKKLEDAKTEKNEQTQNYAYNLMPKFRNPNTTSRVNFVVFDNTLDQNCRNNVKKRNLTKHTQYTRIRTGGKRFKCGFCQHSSINKADLIKHIRTHTGEKPYKCEQCHKCFSEKGNLRKHMRTHTGEKPHKCEVCKSRFTWKAHLKIHMRSHTGEKPYKCVYCDSCFSVSSHLVTHMRTHTGERPYECEVCQRCFSVKEHLTIHFRTHTGEKPYKCKECQRCFIRRDALTRHIRTHSY
ncbi:hypothetical protein PYW08_012379 [Mythimna loreyi]|uniref:Uncharacterized protein n=1 Tax=Mythimna loreyi TaxID=667449 RepID=A0ACC2PZZ0_9NEOP|nr:hypothetical protein PYW08_012379 [Mythimna loreyi]